MQIVQPVSNGADGWRFLLPRRSTLGRSAFIAASPTRSGLKKLRLKQAVLNRLSCTAVRNTPGRSSVLLVMIFVCLRAQTDDLVAQHSGIFVFHHVRGLAHLRFEFFDLTRKFLPRHLYAALALVFRCGRGGDFDQIPDGFHDGLRHDAVRLVIRILNLASSCRLVHGARMAGVILSA